MNTDEQQNNFASPENDNKASTVRRIDDIDIPQRITPKEAVTSQRNEDKIDIKLDQTKKNLFFQLQGPKKKILMGLVGILIIGLLGALLNYYFFAESLLTVKALDEKSQQELIGVIVSVGNQTKETDDFGKARFDKLRHGEQTVQVTLEGYDQVAETVNLKRGDNGIYIVTLDLILIQVSGNVYDYIDKDPIKDVDVTLNKDTIKTDEKGYFVFEDVVPGKQKVTFQSAGVYLTREIEVTGLYDTQLGDFFLVPDVKVVFVSNRDGNKAVYKSYLNGESVEKLWENKKGFDDFNASLSPSGEYIAFLTNRDAKEDSHGNYLNYLYVNTISGLGLTKVTDTDSSVVWFDDSTGFLTLNISYIDNVSHSRVDSWSFETKSLKPLFEDANFETLQASSSAVISDLKIAANDTMVFRVSNFKEPLKAGIYKSLLTSKDFTQLTNKSTQAYSLSEDRDKVRFTYYDSDVSKRYEVDIATGKEKEIEFERRNGQQMSDYYTWDEKYSEDGTRKAYIDYRDGKNDLFIANAQGEFEIRLSKIGGVTDFEFVNDKYLIFFVQKQEESAVYIMGFKEVNDPIKITDVSEFVGVIE